MSLEFLLKLYKIPQLSNLFVNRSVKVLANLAKTMKIVAQEVSY